MGVGGGREPRTTCSSRTRACPASGIMTATPLREPQHVASLASLASCLPLLPLCPQAGSPCSRVGLCARPQRTTHQHAGPAASAEGPKSHALSNLLPRGRVPARGWHSVPGGCAQGVLCLEGDPADPTVSITITDTLIRDSTSRNGLSSHQAARTDGSGISSASQRDSGTRPLRPRGGGGSGGGHVHRSGCRGSRPGATRMGSGRTPRTSWCDAATDNPAGPVPATPRGDLFSRADVVTEGLHSPTPSFQSTSPVIIRLNFFNQSKVSVSFPRRSDPQGRPTTAPGPLTPLLSTSQRKSPEPVPGL